MPNSKIRDEAGDGVPKITLLERDRVKMSNAKIRAEAGNGVPKATLLE